MDWFQASEIEQIRNISSDMDRTGIFHEAALNIIYQHKLFKLFVPERYNGRFTALPEALRIFEQASWIDGNFGWAVTIGSGGGYFVSNFPPDVSESVFGPRNALIAGSGNATGTAVRVEGGYRLSGKWGYCSGAPNATTFTATAVVGEGQEVLAFALEPEQAEIVTDWHAFGLRATGSHSIAVHDVFVPDERVFRVGHPEYDDSPIYTYPFMAFAVASFAAVCLGMGRHFLDECAQLVETNKIRWDRTNPARAKFVSERIEEGKALLDTHSKQFYDAAEQSWSAHVKGEADEAYAEEVIRSGRAAAAAVLHSAQSLFPHLGMAALMEHQTVNRLWRDLHTAAQHASLKEY